MTTLLDLIEPENRLNQGLVESEVQGTRRGFCMAFSVQWVINCHQSGAGSPVDEFRSMKAQGLFYFKQLIQNQKAYGDHWNENWSSSDPVNNSKATQTVVSLMSNQNRNIIPIDRYEKTPENLTQKILELALAGPHARRSSLITLWNYTMGHEIAATLEKQENTWRWSLLDPNFGLITFALRELDIVIDTVWRQYKVRWAGAVMVV